MAKREQQAKLGGRKRAAVRRTEEQHAESLLLRLQTDSNHSAQSLAHGQLTEAPESLFALERSPGGIAPEIPEYHEAAQPGDQVHQMIVQAFFLRSGAKIFREPDGDDRSGPLRISGVQEQRPLTHPH